MSVAPTISVLVPVYNGEAYLAECLESVLGQTRSDWELVIADNRSTDRSAEIARRFTADPRVRLVLADEHVDVHASHNRAARLMDPRARWAKFLGADDRLYPTALERMVGLAERHPEVGVVSSYRLTGAVEDHHGLVPAGQEVFPGPEVVRRALTGGPWVTGSPSSLLYRADLVRAREPFLDPTVWHSDTDAAHRTLLGADLGFVHEVLTFTRLHARSLTCFSDRVNSYLTHAGRMLVRYGPAALGDRYPAAMRRWLRTYAWWLAKQALKPSRRASAEFCTFQRAEIDRIRAELGGQAVFSTALRVCRALVPGAEDGGGPPGGGRQHAVAGAVAAELLGFLAGS